MLGVEMERRLRNVREFAEALDDEEEEDEPEEDDDESDDGDY